MLNSLAPRNQEKSTGLRFCRCLIRSIVLVVFSSGPNALAVRQEPSVVEANRVVELTFTAENPSADPFNTIDLDVTFTAPLAARSVLLTSKVLFLSKIVKLGKTEGQSLRIA